MTEPIHLTSGDPILKSLNFKAYQSKAERRIIPFLPGLDEPQTIEIDTLWGSKLTARPGDFLISEVESPFDFWPINPVIFEETYIITRPGYTTKVVKVNLTPLTEVTNGDPDRLVAVVTLEGIQKVRAGDFYLAKGVKGEIWPIPKSKADSFFAPLEDESE
jgi:hypothetical protein